MISQTLFLMNLLLLPGISFLLLIWLFFTHKPTFGWQRIHLYRAMQLSIAVGIFLVGIPLFIMLFSTQFQASIMVILVYFVTLHAAFVLLGMLNIARAMSAKLPFF